MAADQARVFGSSLTPREREVMQLLSHGCTTREIAKHMSISSHTVSTLVERIFDKLEVNDRAQAVAVAFRLGLVE